MDKSLADFSLLGGPLHRLGGRWGLVRGGTDTVALGLVLGGVPWLVLALLAMVDGLVHVLFSMDAIGASVRLLLAIPLFFLCETLIDPQAAAFLREIVRSHVVPVDARPALESITAQIARWRDAWLPEACLFLLAVALGFATPQQSLFAYLPGHAGAASATVTADTLTSHWYWSVCMTLFRFLLFRWLWRIALWCWFLLRVARLDLRPVPTHPDRAGGLGYIEFVHAEFTSLILAFSAVQSATFAQDIASGRMAFEAIYPGVAMLIAVDAALFIGPLFIFSRKLRRCRVKGIRDYSELGERYVNAFESKWLAGSAPSEEHLLGTPDISTLADLSTSVDIIRDMRTVPLSTNMLIYMAAAALLPLVPLALFKYPLTALLEKFFEMLTGV